MKKKNTNTGKRKSDVFKAIAALIAAPILGMIVLMFIMGIPWLLIYVYGESQPEPAKPEITHGEFPFTVVYTLDGRKVTYKDTILCDYKGSEWNEGSMKKYRVWEKNYKNCEEPVVYRISENEYVALVTGPSAAYLMGDKENSGGSAGSGCGAKLVTKDKHSTTHHFLSDEELLEEYKIKIISCEVAPPIENTFK